MRTSAPGGQPSREGADDALDGEVFVLPASFAQERLWFLDQVHPHSPAYNIPLAFRLRGRLDVAALARSLEALAARHEVLRTTFSSVEGEARQVIAPAVTVSLPVVDLQALRGPERELEIQRRAVEEARKPFDLARGPLVRATALRLSPEEHVLLLTQHHIVSDGWSLGILFRELSALYAAALTGTPASLPELPVQYADYAVWQRDWLRGDVLERQLAYWRRQLAGVPVLELPTDRPRPPTPSFRGARQARPLPPALADALRALSRAEGVTLFMTLLAAFQTLLLRYTGLPDLAVGSPIANRPRPELEGLIGFFVNTLVLRTDLAGDPSFRELLGRVREVALGAYAHQDLPFEKLVEDLNPARTLSHSPLFQVLFVLQNAPSGTLDLPGLAVAPLPVGRGTVKFDLILTVVEQGPELRAVVDYSTDLFDAPTITHLLGHLQILLAAIVADPDRPLSAPPLLTDAERRQVLVESNRTEVSYPRDVCLHQLFEAQVQRAPEAVAVVFEDQHLTYRALNTRANQLAHRLRTLGVGPEVLVGLHLERSLEMVVALLGILKAGGAYVPLDPAYPPARLAFLLQDTRAPIVLTQSRLLPRLPPHPAHVLCLDRDGPDLAREPDHDPPCAATPDTLAYVIYTSGSTGQPKGVMVEHRQILNYVLGIADRCGLEPPASFAMVQPLSVDASQTVIFPALISGGTLHVISEARVEDPLALGEYFSRHPIDLLKIAPSHLAALLTSPRPERLMPRRWLIVGGEALRRDWIETFQALAPCVIFNHYGPTEATVGMLTYRVAPGADDQASTVPLGRPLPNTRAYVLDRHLQPVPTGIPGELYIGGRCVARGYLNRPDLTAERFVPDPFRDEPDARLYRTGDLVRYRPDGNLEFLGRVDDQVKIRGFRVEPGEIAVALGQHPALRDVAVVAREDDPGDVRLVAYVVPRGDLIPPASALRSFLRTQLPDHMLPSAFVPLPALPRTIHGKLDRRALPAPDPVGPPPSDGLVSPRTPVEAALAKIWAAVLKLETVGIHDNFFELGGDSILSIQIVARARQAGVAVTPRQLFQHQTIAELAAVAGTHETAQAEQGPVTGTAPLTPIQHRFFELRLPDPHHYNQAVLLEAREGLEPASLRRVFGELLRHHDALRLRFRRAASGWQQSHAAPDDAVPLSTVDLSALPEAAQGPAIETAAAELQRSLGLSEGPLLRAAFFDLGPRRPGRLLIIVHHLAIDGVSWRVLLDDLVTASGQLSRGEGIHFPPKTTSFKHWAERLAEHARSGALEREIDYWLAGPRMRPPRLPVDHPGSAGTVASASAVRVSLSVAETRALLREVPGVYRTQINDVLLTAVGQAFAGWTGAPSLLVELEGHGREAIGEGLDLSRTLGWFTTRFPVLLELPGSLRPADALRSIKEQLRRIPSRGIGYGLLRYCSENVAVAERLRRAPPAEVSFNYLGQLDQMLPEGAPFARARESSGPARSPGGGRECALAISGRVLEGQLRVDWTFSPSLHRRPTIERLAEGFLEALRGLIADCRSSGARGYAPSDFPEADLSQSELDQVLADLEELRDPS